MRQAFHQGLCSSQLALSNEELIFHGHDRGVHGAKGDPVRESASHGGNKHRIEDPPEHALTMHCSHVSATRRRHLPGLWDVWSVCPWNFCRERAQLQNGLATEFLGTSLRLRSMLMLQRRVAARRRRVGERRSGVGTAHAPDHTVRTRTRTVKKCVKTYA